MMKKILKLVVVFTLLFGGISAYHVHDDKCGYNQKQKQVVVMKLI